MPRRVQRAIVTHPYWTCFSRAFITAVLVSVAILVLVHKAILMIFVIEWISGWRQSRNTQIQIESHRHLRYFSVVWGFGRAVGALTGIVLSTLLLNPTDPTLFHWRSWPTVQWVQKLLDAMRLTVGV